MAGYAPTFTYDLGYVSTLNIESITINPKTLTSAELFISKKGMTLEPGSYQVTRIPYDTNGTLLTGSSYTETFTPTDTTIEPTFEITSLTPGIKYDFSVTAYKNTAFGNTITTSITMSNTTSSIKVVSGGISDAKISMNKSFLQLTAPTVKNQYSIATRSFGAITIPTATLTSIPGLSSWYGTSALQKVYNDGYFSFGASLYMDSIITSPNQGAGIGFFTNAEGTKGYYLVIETTALAASQDRKSIRIVKFDGTAKTPLADSQKTQAGTFEGIYGGTQYNIDIKVKVSQTSVDIVAYVNGFKITATDSTKASATTGINYLLDVTQNVGVICTSGTASYDYVYGLSINKDAYDSNSYNPNIYQGQFSNDLLNTSYGETIYNAGYKEDIYNQANSNTMVDEFGTTVREITKASVRFTSRPAFPIKWSTGGNRLVKVLGSKISSFGAEAYVLNNTSTTIPLADNNLASFQIFGNTLSPSGQLEYATDEVSTYTTAEPITFQSKWIQTEADAKSLAEWIKSKVINKGKLVTMSVFGNPLIAIGDIVSITYPYQGFDGTQKFVVTNINHVYQDGLETSITCRLIAH